MHSLAGSYSRTLRVGAAQELVETGPYGALRHPGYAGSLLVWSGFALTTGSVPCAAVIGALMGAAYRRRISIEERLLERELPGYREYQRRTDRVVPGLW